MPAELTHALENANLLGGAGARDGLRWTCAWTVEKFLGRDKHQLAHARPDEVVAGKGNLLMLGGASCLWECLIGNGTATAGQNLTFFNNANTAIAVGDGFSATAAGTVAVTNGSATVTGTGSSFTTDFAVGDYLVLPAGDGAIYKILSIASNTSLTLTANYGGTTASGLTAKKIPNELPTQTDLQSASNKARVGMNASYPQHTDGTAGKTITAATNASPIVVTSAAHGFTTGNWVNVTGVVGNTAANGVWQITVVDTNTFSLNNSTGNGTWTSGGVASVNSVLVLQATFGAAQGNFAWNEFGIANALSGGRLANRKVSALGTKASGSSWQFTVAIGLS